MVDELTMFPEVLYNPVNRILPVVTRLAAVATPVDSIVVSLALSATIAAAFVAPVAFMLIALVLTSLLKAPDV